MSFNTVSAPGAKRRFAPALKVPPGAKSCFAPGPNFPAGVKSVLAPGPNVPPGVKSDLAPSPNVSPGVKSVSAPGLKLSPGVKSLLALAAEALPGAKRLFAPGGKRIQYETGVFAFFPDINAASGVVIRLFSAITATDVRLFPFKEAVHPKGLLKKRVKNSSLLSIINKSFLSVLIPNSDYKVQ